MEAQKAAYELNGNNLSWNAYGFSSPEATRADPHYFDNPYWMRNTNYSTDSRDRFIGNMVLNYEINDWLNVMGRVTNDNYSELREERIGSQSVDVAKYSKYTKTFFERNYDLFLNFDKDLNDKLNLFGMVGTNLRRSAVNITDGQTNGGLVVPGVYSFSNSVNTPEAASETDAARAVDGYLGRATLAYDRFLYLDLSARYDVSSTLPVDNNSFFYPAATASLIYSELFDISGMDFGKLRLNYAQVGNDAPMQRLQNIYSMGTAFGSSTSPSFTTILFLQISRSPLSGLIIISKFSSVPNFLVKVFLNTSSRITINVTLSISFSSLNSEKDSNNDIFSIYLTLFKKKEGHNVASEISKCSANLL